MAGSVSVAEVARCLRMEHPLWSFEGSSKEAQRLMAELDESLLDALACYVREGTDQDVTWSDFSVLGLKATMRSSYLEALRVMSVAMTDEDKARAIVTRRAFAL